MDKTNYLQSVREQYEDYPYPERNPIHETKGLYTVFTDCLDRVNHYCFSGRKDFSLGARVLVAGGGTGDSIIFLAEQLRDTGSDVVYLDMSKASMEIAKERANVRGLENITWIQDSLLNIPSLDLGKFDYINCTGVLHHLKDPNAGLLALRSALKGNGAMSLMVYALYGRTALYQVQTIASLINKHENDMPVKINNCRKILDVFPSSPWTEWANPKNVSIPDIELYDRFLHSQDRAYTIPQLYEFVESAGLNLIKLFPQNEIKENDLNDPGLFINDNELLSLVRTLDLREQQTISELLHGQIRTHTLYAMESQPASSHELLNNIPALTMLAPRTTYTLLYNLVCSAGDYVVINVADISGTLSFKNTINMELFFNYLDGERTIKAIFDMIIVVGHQNNRQENYDSLNKEFKDMFFTVCNNNMIHMRHKSVPAATNSEEIRARMS